MSSGILRFASRALRATAELHVGPNINNRASLAPPPTPRMTPYPRGTLRSLLTAHAPASSTLSSSFDAAAFLSYRAFLLRLARETRARATEEQYGPRANVGKKGKVVVGKKVVRRANKVRPCGPRSAAELTDVWVGSVGRVEGAQGLSLAGSGTTTYTRDWMAAPSLRPRLHERTTAPSFRRSRRLDGRPRPGRPHLARGREATRRRGPLLQHAQLYDAPFSRRSLATLAAVLEVPDGGEARGEVVELGL